jgi:hypothetical protein
VPLAVLVTGWICIDKPTGTAGPAASPWAKPDASARRVGRPTQTNLDADHGPLCADRGGGSSQSTGSGNERGSVREGAWQ